MKVLRSVAMCIVRVQSVCVCLHASVCVCECVFVCTCVRMCVCCMHEYVSKHAIFEVNAAKQSIYHCLFLRHLFICIQVHRTGLKNIFFGGRVVLLLFMFLTSRNLTAVLPSMYMP